MQWSGSMLVASSLVQDRITELLLRPGEPAACCRLGLEPCRPGELLCRLGELCRLELELELDELAAEVDAVVNVKWLRSDDCSCW